MSNPIRLMLHRRGVTDPEAFLIEYDTAAGQRRRAHFDRWYRCMTARLR